MWTALAAALALSAIAASGCGDSAAEKDLKSAKALDRAFLVASITLNERAIELSKLVPKHGDSKVLKTFAATVEGDRTKELVELRRYATELGVDTNAAVTDEVLKPLSWKRKDLYLDGDVSKLEKSDGATFDDLYLKLLLQNIDGSIRAARPQVTYGGSKQLVELAQKLISARSLENEQAKKIQRRLND